MKIDYAIKENFYKMALKHYFILILIPYSYSIIGLLKINKFFSSNQISGDKFPDADRVFPALYQDPGEHSIFLLLVFSSNYVKWK